MLQLCLLLLLLLLLKLVMVWHQRLMSSRRSLDQLLLLLLKVMILRPIREPDKSSSLGGHRRCVRLTRSVDTGMMVLRLLKLVMMMRPDVGS